MTQQSDPSSTPVPVRRILPPRAIWAALVSALTVALVVGLATLGGVDRPATQTFQFLRGTALAQGEETRLRGFLVPALQDARISVVIVGHTGDQGDAAANLDLSAARAALVADLATSMGIDPDQIDTAGAGGGAPLPRAAGQADRAYQSSLARVDVTLQVRR